MIPETTNPVKEALAPGIDTTLNPSFITSLTK